MLADVLPLDLKIEQVLDTAAELGDMEQSPRGELWLLEKTGTIRVYVAGVERASLTLPVATGCGIGLVDATFAPDYGSSGRAFVYYVDYYVDSTGVARVDEVFVRGAALELGPNILDLGTTPGGCRAGGGLDVGADGKLYIAVGDLETSGDAQNDNALAGKVLRAELDGGIPMDNLSGTLVWAKGFLDGTDLEVGSSGRVYVADLGNLQLLADDEVNAVHEGGNYGWDIVAGDSGGVYDDPLVSHMPPVGTEGLAMLTTDSLGEEQQNTLLYVRAQDGQIQQAVLTGADLDQLESLDLFYDSEGDADGSPDAGCPEKFNALTEGDDGWLYGVNSGDNPGVWRVWHDHPGPREVSAPGSPFAMTLARTETGLEMGWENLGPLDSGRPARHGNQHEGAYQIWEGDLANVASYDHHSILTTDGTTDGPARRTAEFIPEDGNRYYIVSAQNDNLEGSVGMASDGTPRPVPGITDYCEEVPYGTDVGQCAEPWYDYSTGEELKLTDYNPNSPTYMMQLSLSDFRGKVIRMDISALNCTYCRQQAVIAAKIEDKNHSRDFVAMTVLTHSFVGAPPIPPEMCASEISTWATLYGVNGPLFCDVDRNGDDHGDVSWQYWWGPTCNGTPQNFYIDQGHTLYKFVCGGELTYEQIFHNIHQEINPETCE
jgi:hypothetical protein